MFTVTPTSTSVNLIYYIGFVVLAIVISVFDCNFSGFFSLYIGKVFVSTTSTSIGPSHSVSSLEEGEPLFVAVMAESDFGRRYDN